MPDDHRTPATAAADDAFLARALRFLDDLLDDGELRQFNADLAASPARREAFVALCELRGQLFEHRLAPGASEASDEPAIVPPPWFEPPVEADAPRRGRPYLAIAAAILLPLVFTASLYLAFRPHPAGNPTIAAATRPVLPVPAVPAATLVATAGARWADAHGRLGVGDPLPAGPLDLRDGFAELRLKTGVTLILQGPARVEVAPDAMSASLALGKLTATVPPDARGFSVQTASATIVDFGTEFGVEVAADRATRVEVFQGEVEAAAAAASQPDDPAQGRRRLTKDQAARVAPDSAAVTPVPPSDAGSAFVRDLAAARMPLPLHNTGVRLDEGDADPHWQVIAGPEGDLPEPRAAFVYPAVPLRYAPNVREQAQWISADMCLQSTPFEGLFPDGAYTFRTAVDLTGFEPPSATTSATVFVDNTILDVRVNGTSIGASLQLDRSNTLNPWHFAIPATAFTQGVNRIELVVLNERMGDGRPSPMALKVEWAATAAPTVLK